MRGTARLSSAYAHNVLGEPDVVASRAAMPARGPANGPGRELLDAITRQNKASLADDTDKFRKIGGGIALHCRVDLERRRVADAASFATLFRGYETLLMKRDLRDAGLISSTASGICGGVHAATSAQCLEMALGIRPPPLGILARNLLLGCQYLNDNPMHLFVLSGPDYSESAIRATNPEIWAKAERATAAHAATHGYATIGAIMTELNRPGGRLFAEALDMMRLARAAYALLGGKYPHSESIVPGGVTLSLSVEQLDAFAAKLAPFHDYALRCARIWDDVFDFLTACDPRYRDLGRGPANLVDFGQWDHEEFYDGTYENCDVWGEKRWSTPGAVIGGELVTTKLSALNAGMEEFVDRAFYDPWESADHAADPLGNALKPSHPWNKTIHRNAAKPGAYSWAPSLAWDGKHVRGRRLCAALYIGARGEDARKPLHAFHGYEPRLRSPGMARSRDMERVRAQSRARLCHSLQSRGGPGMPGARQGADRRGRDAHAQCLRPARIGAALRRRLRRRGARDARALGGARRRRACQLSDLHPVAHQCRAPHARRPAGRGRAGGAQHDDRRSRTGRARKISPASTSSAPYRASIPACPARRS